MKSQPLRQITIATKHVLKNSDTEYIFEREFSDDLSVMSQEKDGIQKDDSFLA